MELGYASPARMLGEVRPSELGIWLALYESDPWGQQRADLRTGIVASTIANAHRGKDSEVFKPSDFMLFLEDREQRKKESLGAALKSFLLGRPSVKRKR